MTWRYFTLDEMRCQCCGVVRMDAEFMDRLDELRDRLGFPLPISSGYRCPAHNRAVSHTGISGPHTTGKAADLLVDRGRAYALLPVAIELGFTGIGLQQQGPSRFVHLDRLIEPGYRPRPTIWSY